VNPDVLLMDEAFSALDVLTGETLRDDMLALWDNDKIGSRGMLIVSHSIEEAVMMIDRILILSSDPGRIRTEIKAGLPRPRDVDSIDVRARIDEVYGLMTARPQAAVARARAQGRRRMGTLRRGICLRLPHRSPAPARWQWRAGQRAGRARGTPRYPTCVLCNTTSRS
jgi:energy-coupling factor transporter ATP-binding protein EcfA2